MKLVQCNECGDIFNLRMHKKTCSCGKVYGQYLDNERAEVGGPHTAIAIGNGSYRSAVMKVMNEQADWRYDGRLERVSKLFKEINELVPTMFMGWARSPNGSTNSHTKHE